MKRCPTCQRTFAEDHLTFCVEDGTPLVVASPGADEADEVTRVRSSAGHGDSASGGFANDNPSPAYQPPGSYVPPGTSGPKRKAWPWVLGIVAFVILVIAGIGIAAAILIPRAMRNANRGVVVNTNVNRSSNPERNLNLNSNSSDDNSNGNDNLGDDSTPPPTDREAVLVDLKELEDEWTVANINADKKKLNRILADDYVGITEGRAQGKAEYLKTIERDPSIQRWEFEDLKVTLSGDRASLSGILRLDVKDQNGQDQQLTFRFTDKFVWRDGRWQATGSEVDPVKPGTAV